MFDVKNHHILCLYISHIIQENNLVKNIKINFAYKNHFYCTYIPREKKRWKVVKKKEKAR